MGKSSTNGSSRCGAFVVLVGPDGVGKTTVARELIRLRRGCTGYVHFRPPFWSPLPHGPATTDQGYRVKTPGSGLRLLGLLRLNASLVAFWAGYLLRVRPAVKRGCLVVGDRWGYGYITQPWALGFHGPRWLARVVVGLLPRPDLLVTMEAPCEVILSRKGELSPEQIRGEMAMARSLPGRRQLSVDATQDTATIATLILAVISGMASSRPDSAPNGNIQR